MLARIGTREALILTDVFGATPCNVAQRLADGVHIKVVTGVNVPMLWRSLCYADESLDSWSAVRWRGPRRARCRSARSARKNQTSQSARSQ